MPIDFRGGLYLEDRGVRLVWYTSPDGLRRATGPDFCAAPEGSAGPLTFAWNDRVFGLRCQVTTRFTPGREALAGVRLVFRYPGGIDSMPVGFRWLGRQLARHFGPPLFSQEDGEQGEARWADGGVAVRHECCAPAR
jgi:hypothetical protein